MLFYSLRKSNVNVWVYCYEVFMVVEDRLFHATVSVACDPMMWSHLHASIGVCEVLSIHTHSLTTHSFTLTHSHSLNHTHSLTPTHSFTLTHSHPLTHSYSLILTHAHPHVCTLSGCICCVRLRRIGRTA